MVLMLSNIMVSVAVGFYFNGCNGPLVQIAWNAWWDHNRWLSNWQCCKFKFRY